MKIKVWAILLLAAMLMSYSGITLAEEGTNSAMESTQDENALTKLGRGLINTATGWLEVPKKIYTVSKEENVILGVSKGIVKGLGWGVARTAVGIYEVVTFPFPIPEGYKRIIDPEYVFVPE